MKKLLVRIALLGAAAGAALAIRSYLQNSGNGSGEVQITFDDGSTDALDAAEVQEYTDIARQLLEAM